MYYFDDIAEEKINGKFYAVVTDSETSSKYLLTANIVVNTSISSFEGIKLSISCFPDKYYYRGALHTEKEMKSMADNIAQIAHQADWKNNSIHSPYRT